MDKRKNYYLTIDTETCNSLDDPIVYDIGGCIHDKKGQVYETFSYIIYEVFYGMKELMQTSYYHKKIDSYKRELKEGSRKCVRWSTAKRHIKEICEKYNVKAIIAHNARFDYRSTATTQRYLTKSKYRYFLPYGIPVWDTLKMCRDTICKQKSYIQWARNHGYVTKNNQVRATAEIIHRYLIGDNNFIESHTGLEDVLIEKDIFVHCMRQHQVMRKECFS